MRTVVRQPAISVAIGARLEANDRARLTILSPPSDVQMIGYIQRSDDDVPLPVITLRKPGISG
jgi:hypothetical protein